ncbi:hypothetical protein FIBSPDRAFT_896857 [Athelia psychrophila]|uniref:Uncharacterized protein n=1 Tax=Athelia psychrophila TaxID=1759441 RepID=A0A166CYB3_9AGAM|nr:hypothetical protein FIBSPDRAFT_896857 [Fibularhizoctonia sp. CBS 109695]
MHRSRQIEQEDGTEGEDGIAPLTKADFIKAPGTAMRDWVAKLVGAWLRQELSAHHPCKHFIWIAWQNTAHHHKLVLIGTDKHMPCQPGVIKVNKGKGSNAHFKLEEDGLPLRIITLDELHDLCPSIVGLRQTRVLPDAMLSPHKRKFAELRSDILQILSLQLME